MENIIIGNVRVQLLSDSVVRIEYADLGAGKSFCDDDTFFVPYKKQYCDTHTAYSVEENVICFGDYELYIPQAAKSLVGIRLEKNGKKIYSCKRLKNSGELPTLDKTPIVFPIADSPRIIVPSGGYSVNRKGEYTVDDSASDIYLLLCEGDAKKLRKLYVELTGRNEMVRLSALGGWNSKYYAYTEDEAKQLILDYEKHDVPLDVMVIDTDWRSCENGWGYDINTKLFPDMKRFMDFAHSHGVEIMFNDHPEPVDGAQIFAPEEIEYREKNLQAVMDLGLDIWWYDRNWSTKLVSPSAGINHETLGLYLFDDVTKHYWQKQSGSAEVYRRPVIMGNVDNIANGCYVGIFSSASHRYSIQWTGDIQSTPDALAQEVDNMIKGANNCIAYINADCGGHLGNPDKQGFIRWMQFGTLSPVFRPHCTNNVVRTREPWAYDEQTLDIVREYNNLRYRLLPVIYKNAYNNYLTGEPIFKGLGWEYPDDKTALACKDEYMLGNDVLISPIAGVSPSIVEKKNFVAPVSITFYDGTECKGEPIATAEWKKLDMSLNHTSPREGVPVYNFSARIKTVVKFDVDKTLYIKCDDGSTVWVDGKKVFEDKTTHSEMLFPICDVAKNAEHDIEIEYFQAGGEASCRLCCCDTVVTDGKRIYLPKDNWTYAFDGARYSGGKTIEMNCGLREMPLFMRDGAVIPLAYDAHNTKSQKWNRLVFDWYADKASCDSGYIYEDDTETTAYKYGKSRTTEYSARYCDKCGAYVLNIERAKGEFDGDRCFATREITIKRHVRDGAKAKRATINGKEVEIKRAAKNADAFPFNTGADAPDGECELIAFVADADQSYEIKLYI